MQFPGVGLSAFRPWLTIHLLVSICVCGGGGEAVDIMWFGAFELRDLTSQCRQPVCSFGSRILSQPQAKCFASSQASDDRTLSLQRRAGLVGAPCCLNFSAEPHLTLFFLNHLLCPSPTHTLWQVSQDSLSIACHLFSGPQSMSTSNNGPSLKMVPCYHPLRQGEWRTVFLHWG
jgi:hypothetical protein